MSASSTPPQQGGPVPDRPETSVEPAEISGDDPSQVVEKGEEGTFEAGGLEAVLRAALDEGRAEVARREEAERKLERVRIEAASLAIELNQAERDLEAARDSVDPSAAERIEKLEEDLDRARSELAGERKRREQLERDYDAAAHQSEKQLAQLRGEATGAHDEVAIARDELAAVRHEVASARDELATARDELATARADHEQQLARVRDEHEQQLAQLRQEHEQELTLLGEEHEQQLALERERAEPVPPPAPLANPPIAAEPPPAEPPPAEPPLQEAPAGRPGRLRRRKRLFETRGRTCAVCRRTEAASPGALQAKGWALGAEIDICPDCGAQGWQLPKGGNLPFRRSSSRHESG
jgi:predicted  nucleic acid-binding Zn-ribbon protein